MLDDLLQPGSEAVLKVTELTRRIKSLLEGEMRQLWIQGEVSNLRKQHSGHVYFSLKDDRSQLPCVLFARDAARQSFELENGMELIVFGDISVYEPHGRYQLIARIAVRSGEGRLQMEFERLKRKLAAEGLFDKEQKQALTSPPQRIAVITSPSGAAVRDFLRVLRRRDYRGEVVIFPARVQGAEAAEECANHLQAIAGRGGFDCIVLTRGGGSLEDLWAFNEEALARAVAACPLPIISAVGHEIDFVLTDFAADVRAETPSSAAELISSLYLDMIRRFEKNGKALADGMRNQLTEKRRHFRELQVRLQTLSPTRRVEQLHFKTSDLETRLNEALRRRLARERERTNRLSRRLLERHPGNALKLARQSLRSDARRLKQSTRVELRRRKEQLAALRKRLENNGIPSVLNRGFAILEKESGDVVTGARSLRPGEKLNARFHDGNADLTVDDRRS
ncbi:MAG: exodeoxyribonuclease VII large subunit [Opitutales bacterium]